MSADAHGDRIEPRLGRFDAAMVVVSLVIGIGIFRTPSLVAQHSGSTTLFFLAWALGGAIALAGALTFAEIGSRRPGAGGYYRVVADLYGPRLAFMLNWAQALMQGAGAAGVAMIGAEYLVPLLPDVGGARLAPLPVALATMTVLLALNGAGIRTGAWAQNLLSLLKIVLIVGLALAALALTVQPAPVAAHPARAAPAFLAALIPVFYTYGGYHLVMNLGGDIRDPRRGLPIAITAGMMLVVALYLLLNAGYVRALGLDAVAGSELVAASLARASLGEVGERVASVAIFLSAAGFVNATILQMPRAFYAMAQDGVLPRVFMRVDPRTQVQRWGLAFFGVTMIVPAFLLASFEKLLSYVLFTDLLTLVVVASTVFVLRRREPGRRDVFRTPLHPVLPALFIACLVAVEIQILVSQTSIALAGLAIFLAGALLFALRRPSAG
ncbi:MAG TPA: APC family permease [Candidatus Saccharimonadia bacterium]|nr:APC family permease [Candidatus Saccharimonadia bacterium]